EGTEVPQQGEWKIVFRGDQLHAQSLNYHLIVISDNATVASEFTIGGGDLGTGERIPITVKLTDRGAPVLNASVEVQLAGPRNSQGDVLSTASSPRLPAPGADLGGTKGQRKLDALYNDPTYASLFADQGIPTITLVDQNTIGVYTGELKNTFVEGHYYFSVRVRSTSATAGRIQRAFRTSRFVRSKPDSNKTVFKLVGFDPQSNGTVLATLQAIPHDKFGNFLGPGYEKDLQIKSTEGGVVSPINDRLDGSYEITYRLPSVTSNPTFTLLIMGETVT